MRPVQLAPGVFTSETGPSTGKPTVTNQITGAGSGMTYAQLLKNIRNFAIRSGLTEREMFEDLEDLVRYQSLSRPLQERASLPVLALLAFAREGIRNPATAAHSTMVLDLVSSGRLPAEQAFGLAGAPTAAGLPQQLEGANAAFRLLEQIRFRETFLRSEKAPLAGTELVCTAETAPLAGTEPVFTAEADPLAGAEPVFKAVKPVRGSMPKTDIGGQRRDVAAQYQAREAALFRQWLQLRAEGLVFRGPADAREVLSNLLIAWMKEFYRLK
jgi:hypothetical protein